MTVQLGDVQDLYWSTERAEKELLPLVLFRGPVTLGSVQSLWNLTQALRASGIEKVADAGRWVAANPDITHSTGLHPSASDLSPNGSAIGDKLWRFTNRIHSCPTVRQADPETYEYLRYLMARSRRMLVTLYPIDRYSPWSKQAWRRPARVPKVKVELPSMWPFLPEAAPVERIDGAELLVAIDGLIPKSLPRQIRDDVCQDVVLAVLEGEITLEDLRDRHREFVKNVFKRFPIKYGHISLDQPPPWDPSGQTLAQTLVAS